VTAETEARLKEEYQHAALREFAMRILADRNPKHRPKQSDVEAMCNTLTVWLLVENKLLDTAVAGKPSLKLAAGLAADLLRELYDKPWRYKPTTLTKMHREGARLARAYPEQRAEWLALLPRHRVRPIFNRRGRPYFPKTI
jgi:hypothetical protein